MASKLKKAIYATIAAGALGATAFGYKVYSDVSDFMLGGFVGAGYKTEKALFDSFVAINTTYTLMEVAPETLIDIQDIKISGQNPPDLEKTLNIRDN